LRDRATIERVLAKAPKDALRVFGLLAEHGPQRVRDLGIPYYVWYSSQRTPLHWLIQHGLVGADEDAQVAWVWFDVIVALNGRLFTDWSSAPPAVSPEPLVDPGAGLPLVLSRLSSLLDLWAAEPAPALASGGLGVRPVRAAAKALGLKPGEVGLLAHLAVGLGLLGTMALGSKGSGRNRTEVRGWAPTDLAAQWRTEAPARQWALLIQTWRDDLTLDESEGLPERVEGGGLVPFSGIVRTALLRLLVELPPERGLPLDALTAVASFRHPALLDPQGVRGVVEAARVLGLVPATGPVGLTRLGRAVLDGPDAVEAALPPPRTEFTVQADQSVIAPPDLALDVSMALERLADIESTAGARIYRLSERRIATALDDGETAASLLDFLERHSTVPLAQNITHLIRDCERRHGRLRAGMASSYLRCDDPALLTSAVGVKAAKLRLLAPTVAVSPLERDKLVAALRGRGLMPVAESSDGATLARQEKVAARKRRSGSDLPPLRRNGVLLDPVALEALAKATLANDDSRVALRLLPQP
jgi:Helicase conserved C-terminal domain